jgi:hypothetical protein
LISHYSNITNATWEWCLKSNGTYLDCPINKYPQKDFIVVAHNPSIIDYQYMRFKVSHAHYNVFLWNQQNLTYTDISTQAAVICVDRYIEGP